MWTFYGAHDPSYCKQEGISQPFEYQPEGDGECVCFVLFFVCLVGFVRIEPDSPRQLKLNEMS